MNERLLLVFNAGSSSLKFEVFGAARGPVSLSAGAVRDIGRGTSSFERDGRQEPIDGVADAHEAALIVLDRLFGREAGGFEPGRIVASGHRVVHGGERFSAPVRVTVSAFAALKSTMQLAPLHNPPALAVMEAVGKRFPKLPIVAMFDTAFFHELPDAAKHYAVPREWRERHGVRRYGFHGIAHQHLAASLARAGAGSRAVTVHLGQGCSATALLEGRPVDTSMGFTPLEGLIMGTRSGDVDPGVLLHLARQGYGWRALDEDLNRRAGLLGLSGASDDTRELLALEADGNGQARLALDAFCLRVRKYVGAYAAVLGGLDAIAIGGGIGENSAALRERILAPLGWLGVDLDRAANDGASGGPARITGEAARVAVHVVPVDEEPIIARAVLDVLEGR